MSVDMLSHLSRLVILNSSKLNPSLSVVIRVIAMQLMNALKRASDRAMWLSQRPDGDTMLDDQLLMLWDVVRRSDGVASEDLPYVRGLAASTFSSLLPLTYHLPGKAWDRIHQVCPPPCGIVTVLHASLQQCQTQQKYVKRGLLQGKANQDLQYQENAQCRIELMAMLMAVLQHPRSIELPSTHLAAAVDATFVQPIGGSAYKNWDLVVQRTALMYVSTVPLFHSTIWQDAAWKALSRCLKSERWPSGTPPPKDALKLLWQQGGTGVVPLWDARAMEGCGMLLARCLYSAGMATKGAAATVASAVPRDEAQLDTAFGLVSHLPDSALLVLEFVCQLVQEVRSEPARGAVLSLLTANASSPQGAMGARLAAKLAQDAVMAVSSAENQASTAAPIRAVTAVRAATRFLRWLLDGLGAFEPDALTSPSPKMAHCCSVWFDEPFHSVYRSFLESYYSPTDPVMMALFELLAHVLVCQVSEVIRDFERSPPVNDVVYPGLRVAVMEMKSIRETVLGSQLQSCTSLSSMHSLIESFAVAVRKSRVVADAHPPRPYMDIIRLLDTL